MCPEVNRICYKSAQKLTGNFLMLPEVDLKCCASGAEGRWVECMSSVGQHRGRGLGQGGGGVGGRTGKGLKNA